MKAKKKILIFLISLISVLTLIAICVVGVPAIYENICKNRKFEEFELNQNVYASNVYIVKESKIKNDISYSVAASGMIFKKVDNKYYILTASHVVATGENERILVGLYDTPTFSEYRKIAENYQGLSSYYEKFYVMPTIELMDENKDLAIVSIESERLLPVLDIALKDAEKNDKICVIGNPDGHTTTTYGCITSNGKTEFSCEGSKQFVQKINAYVTGGSSGAMVLNADSDIVGIVLGGGEDFLGRFKYGAIISAEDIRNFLGY